VGPELNDGPGAVPTWERAWGEALYGPRGFYRRPEGPAGHFRTASHAAGRLLAEALVRLAGDAGCTGVVDVGAGRGELLGALAAADPALDLHGIDVVDRPPGLPELVGWSVGAETLATILPGMTRALPGMTRALPGATGARRGPGGVLVLAWELLDVVPCPVLEADEGGVLRVVHVDPRTGVESLGAEASEADLTWCRDWWPPEDGDRPEPGTRVEVGRTRDDTWARLVEAVAASGPGVLVAVDYGHLGPSSPEDGGGPGLPGRRPERLPGAVVVTDRARDLLGGRPEPGTLAAFRSGRAVPPVPDGRCDLTAHVALDAVAAAGVAAGATAGLITTQDEALGALGVSHDGVAHPAEDGSALLARLDRAGQVAELTDPGGLGGFGWLVQAVGGGLPGTVPGH